MSGILELMKLCRFCLVKDKVDVPIFGEANDVKQIFMKISACLPVKVSRDDNLPKNICDNCVYKVESLYHFWNTTVSSEKQLIQWLGELGVNVQKPSLHSIQPETVILKQEKEDSNENESLDIFGYNQQYQSNQNPPAETSTSTTTTSNKKTPAKAKTKAGPKRRGRPPGKKTEPPAKRRTRQKEPETSEDDDDSIGADDVPTQDDSDEDFGNRVAKEEQESEDDFDNTDALEPTTYIDVPSENADNDQPGPSGINKPAPITATDVGLTTEFGTETLKCISCNKLYKDKEKLKRHMLYSHTQGSIPCPKCDKKFRIPYYLNKHMLTHAEEYPISCEICDRSFKTQSALYNHKIRNHSDNRPSYKCDNCDKIYASKQALDHHKAINHEGFRFTCHICGKQFADKWQFNKHVAKHDPTSDLSKFKKKKFVPKPKVCEICGITLKSLAIYKKHLRIHRGEKLVKCKICDGSFRTNANLKSHLLVHTNEKPHSCQECGKCFRQKGHLKIHMAYHTGVRPFTCLCGKSFVTNQHLKTHSKNCSV